MTEYAGDAEAIWELAKRFPRNPLARLTSLGIQTFRANATSREVSVSASSSVSATCSHGRSSMIRGEARSISRRQRSMPSKL